MRVDSPLQYCPEREIVAAREGSLTPTVAREPKKSLGSQREAHLNSNRRAPAASQRPNSREISRHHLVSSGRGQMAFVIEENENCFGYRIGPILSFIDADTVANDHYGIYWKFSSARWTTQDTNRSSVKATSTVINTVISCRSVCQESVGVSFRGKRLLLSFP